ncbi:hypothetical protein B0H17DRAFT_1194064 [Mycena rosella]|uniref:Uncharacterized protein n=1 Tax=Mycena rosella TaxID=1033263 RepID=A0AAD7GNY4_MYCRO|nr:hypothetical protein B0H17DRAFT_1194064 [Mycena rosella]
MTAIPAHAASGTSPITATFRKQEPCISCGNFRCLIDGRCEGCVLKAVPPAPKSKNRPAKPQPQAPAPIEVDQLTKQAQSLKDGLDMQLAAINWEAAAAPTEMNRVFDEHGPSVVQSLYKARPGLEAAAWARLDAARA